MNDEQNNETTEKRPHEVSSTELLDCPFCGSSASVPRKDSERGRAIWAISCNQWCVTMRRGTRKAVINDWNKRQANN